MFPTIPVRRFPSCELPSCHALAYAPAGDAFIDRIIEEMIESGQVVRSQVIGYASRSLLEDRISGPNPRDRVLAAVDFAPDITFRLNSSRGGQVDYSILYEAMYSECTDR